MARHPLLCRWCLNLAFSWFATSLGYYVISTSTSSVMGDMDFYLAFSLIAIVEIPFILVLTIAMKYIGRRALLAGTLIACGVICLVAVIAPGDDVTLGCAILAKGFVSTDVAIVSKMFIRRCSFCALDRYPQPSLWSTSTRRRSSRQSCGRWASACVRSSRGLPSSCLRLSPVL